MPAVVRGGRRARASSGPARKAAAPRGPARSSGGRRGHAPATPDKLAALGRLDVSPRTAALGLAGAVVLVGAILFTGARAERIGDSVGGAVDGVVAGMGLRLNRVHVQGASERAQPAIEQALQLTAGQAITSVDLDAVRAQAESVGWVKSARVVRLLPDTLIVAVTEHDRLAVWQTGGVNHVISAEGAVIPGAWAGDYPQLPLVVGAGADQAAGEILPLLRQRPRLMGRVEALVRVDERRWDLRLKDGGVIQLPAVNQEAALIQLDAMDQRERLLDLGFARVDLRTPEAVAVRPAGAA